MAQLVCIRLRGSNTVLRGGQVKLTCQDDVVDNVVTRGSHMAFACMGLWLAYGQAYLMCHAGTHIRGDYDWDDQ